MVAILLRNLEWLSDACRAYLKFVVTKVVAQFLLKITAQCRAIFNPHSVGMIYLHHDAVIGGEHHVNKKIVVACQPLFYNCLDFVFLYHIFSINHMPQGTAKSLPWA